MSDNNRPNFDFDFHGKALDNIFETYAEMRDKCPVGHSERYGGFWFISKNNDIFAAEQDPERYSVAPSMLLPSFGTDIPMIPIDIDPPEHWEYRKILLPLFTPQAIRKIENGIRMTARELAGKVLESLEQGTADVSSMFARPVPTIVFSRIAGFPEQDWPRFDAWVYDIIYARVEYPERAKDAAQAVMDYFNDLLIARRNTEPREDIIQKLLEARLDGKPLSHDELISYCYLLFVAGLDTTVWAIRSSLWYLGQNLEDQRRLREDPELIYTAVEEFLRTLSPVQAMARTCLADTVIQGQKISAGERVVLVFGSGNRDPDAYDHPEKIQIDREDNKHLAFGAGIHRCLGSNLARAELVISLQEFLSIVPEFTLAEPSEQWHGIGKLTIRMN